MSVHPDQNAGSSRLSEVERRLDDRANQIAQLRTEIEILGIKQRLSHIQRQIDLLKLFPRPRGGWFR